MKKILTIAAMLSLCVFGAKAQVLIQDHFTYADGVTTNVSSMVWSNYSGIPDTFVLNQKLQVFGSRAADIWRPFTNTPGSTFYASFTVNATNLVNNATNYIATFAVNATTFKGRLFTVVGPAVGAPNCWRLGIANAAGNASPAVKVFPLDLATNVDYQVVMSFDASGAISTLWVDPVVATDANVQAIDTPAVGTILFFAFRQSNSAATPPLLVDDLFVGVNFSDISVGTPKPATIYTQPVAGPTTVFTGNNYTLFCVGGGAGTVTFQWQHAGTNLVDDVNHVGSTSNLLSLVTAVPNQAGAYRCIVTSTTNSVLSGSVTSSVANVTVSAAPVPPVFITQPVSQTYYNGQNAVFSTTVNSPGTISYQWFSNNVALAGETLSTLTLNNVAVSYSGSQYKVSVTNSVVPTQGIVSTNAVLTVINPPAVTVKFLRSLVDPVTLLPTNTTTPFSVTGVITTFTNITTGNTASYWLQDGTGGINIFATFGSAFRPQQGDSVTFVGTMSQFTSGIELIADTVNNTATSYVTNSSGNPLPAAQAIPFTLTNTVALSAINTNTAGSRVTLSGVYFGASAGSTILTSGNQTVTVTNAAGVPFNLSFFNLNSDTAGQTLPAYASSVTGVLYGLTPNYSVAVTKFSDIVAATPPVPPPVLNLSTSGSTLTLTWAGASVLQAATNVAGPYVAVPGAASPFVTNGAASSVPVQFFRLLAP